MINLENIKPINDQPLKVDYNNMDDEGAIRLDNRGARDSISELKLDLKEGELVWISDDELDYLGVVIRRREIWCVVPIIGTRQEIQP